MIATKGILCGCAGLPTKGILCKRGVIPRIVTALLLAVKAARSVGVRIWSR